MEFRTECRLKNGIGQSQQAIIYVHVKLPGVIGRGVVVNLAVGVGSSVNKRDIINPLGKNETSYLAISGSKQLL